MASGPMTPRYFEPKLFIGGKPRATAQRAEVIDPATEDVVGEAPLADAADIADAITAAERGLVAWSATPPWQRAEIMRRISLLLRERIEDIAYTMTREVGKPLAEARVEAMSAVEHFDWCADETRRLYDRSWSGRTPGSRLEVRHQPVGIVFALTAWNFPIGLAARKLAAALGAGCSVILRPADEAPGTAAALVAACHDAGLPDGAVNLLFGSPETVVEPLMKSPRIRKVSFTGSTRVGQILIRQSADTLKKLTLELGGHAPFIVLDDVDVDKAAAAATMGKFRNAGQVCTSPTRFLVAQSIAGAFAESFATKVRELKVGNGLDPAVQVGPLTTSRQRDRIERLVGDAVAHGARVAAGGRRPGAFNRGFFFEPTVLVEPDGEAAILTEEPFGPTAIVQSFASDDDAVRMANAVDYGLASYIYTPDLRRADAIASGLEAGVVGVNTNVVALPEGPFGGVKHSGYGREGGAEGLQEYLVPKLVHRA